MPNYNNKTKDELINELKKLQLVYDSLKTSFEKDITERKQVDELLKENTERLHEAQKLAHIGVWDWKPDTDTVTWTDELYNIAGLDPMLPAPTYKEHSSLYTPESWKLLKTSVEKAMEKGESYQLELELIRPNGDIRYVNAFGGAKYDSKGQVNGLFGTVQDITERKLALEVIKESEERYRSLFENMLNGLAYCKMIFDGDYAEDFIYLEVNKAFKSLTGLKDVEGKRVSEIIPGIRMSDKELFDAYTRVSLTGIPEVFETYVNTLKMWFSISVYCPRKEYFVAVFDVITDRKEAEEALRLEKENFRHSLDDSPLGVRIVTIEGNTIYANKAILNFYGYDSLDELQNTPLKNRYTTESYSQAQERKRQRERGDLSSIDYEISIIRKNGEIRHLQVFRKEILWAGTRQFQVIYNDITQRKMAEAALQESEELLRIVMTNAPISIFATDDKGIFILHEGKALEKVGMKSGENVGVSAYDLFSKLKVVEQNGEIINGESVLNRVLGGESLSGYTELNGVHFDNQFVPILDINNHIKGLIGVATDVTTRKQVEEALRESEAKFRSIFENSFVGISIARPGGRLLQVNHAYARMYGYKNPEELLSEVSDTKALFASPEERKEVLQELHRKGFMEPKEFELIRQDGSHFFVMVSAGEIRDSDGKVIYNQATHIDLTERRLMEEELRNSKELLEKLNQRLNEIRENERAVISREIHDQLGQSMTALKLDLNRLQKYLSANPEAIAKLEGMVELVSNTIKDVQRISSDLRPGILDELGLVSAIEWYCDEFEKRTGIKCNLELENSDIGNSQVNLTFFRVLQETLTNVIRHAKASIVKVTLHQTLKGTTLVIKDNGIGIPADKLDSNQSLGLISMRERIKQFNGKIDISSKKGKGTKLTFFIPS